ncbi:reverse transcriptase domain-containing protein [Tanacetum coccineum]
MLASRLGTSSEEIEQVIAQRVANVIEAIAIYQSKMRMAHDLMNQVIRDEATVGKNIFNKKKWVSDHGRDSDQQQSKRIEVWGGQKDWVAAKRRLCREIYLTATIPLNFKGTEGVVGLTRWFEKIETVFHINNCPKKYQVKYALCTLQDSVLTWYNSHKRTIGTDVAYAMTWKALIKLMTKVYYPRNEIQTMETELWNLSVKGNDLTAYTQRFQELILLCTKIVLEEEDRVEKFIGGLPNNIQGNVIAAEPQDTTCYINATHLDWIRN